MLTLDNGTRLLALYETMAEAARANDWDTLAALGEDAEMLRRTAATDTRNASSLPAADQHQLAELIGRIQTLDSEIRLHAEPAHESTRKLLTTSVRGRNLRNAYGAG